MVASPIQSNNDEDEAALIAKLQALQVTEAVSGKEKGLGGHESVDTGIRILYSLAEYIACRSYVPHPSDSAILAPENMQTTPKTTRWTRCSLIKSTTALFSGTSSGSQVVSKSSCQDSTSNTGVLDVSQAGAAGERLACVTYN